MELNGSGTNTIIYSNNGISWTGLGATLFTSAGYGITWSNALWVAVGTGSNVILYSSSGITWSSVTTTLTTGYGVSWNGNVFVAVGAGTNQIEYSYNGIIWYAGNNSIFSTAYGVSSNFVGPYIQDSQIVLDLSGIEQTNQLDVYSENYSFGFNNFSTSFKAYDTT